MMLFVFVFFCRRPNMRECRNPRQFFCGRKHAHGFNVQATCDADRRFWDVDIRQPSTCGDSMAHITSDFGQDLLQGRLPPIYHLVGDAAYVNSSYLLTPAGGAVDTWADSYNFHQSSIRMNIECSFGMLVRRWGILWKPLEMRFNRMNKVIMCCFKLHNLCVDRRLGEYELNAVDLAGGARTMAVLRRPRFDRDGAPVSLLVWHGHEGRADPGGNAPPGMNQPGLPQPNVAKRDAMILKYQQAGVLRPSCARA